MKKFILFLTLCFFCFKPSCIAQPSERMLVSPVNIPTMQSSYGIYPNTIDMLSNNIINSLNSNADYNVPDLNTAKGLINSYGLSKDYKEFLMDYRDNRIIDYETCNQLAGSLGVNKILLVSGGFNLQDMALSRQGTGKMKQIPFMTIPLYFAKIITDGAFLVQLPFISSQIYSNFSDEDPIKPQYRINVLLTLVDAPTGLILWEKAYKDTFEASYFEVPTGSFGENQLYSEKLRKLSEKISRETSLSLAGYIKTSETATVKSAIISDINQNNQGKTITRDGKTTRDGHPFLNNGYENIKIKKKENYKNWVKKQVKN